MGWEELLRDIMEEERAAVRLDDPVVLLIPERLLGPIMRLVEEREEEDCVTVFTPLAMFDR